MLTLSLFIPPQFLLLITAFPNSNCLGENKILKKLRHLFCLSTWNTNIEGKAKTTKLAQKVEFVFRTIFPMGIYIRFNRPLTSKDRSTLQNQEEVTSWKDAFGCLLFFCQFFCRQNVAQFHPLKVRNDSFKISPYFPKHQSFSIVDWECSNNSILLCPLKSSS